jgi:ubiquitin carboxyl-terminal hydrolase 5/13
MQNNISAWEEEVHPCEHTLILDQNTNFRLRSKLTSHCNSCDLSQNLWMCLTCGYLGCGRKFYDRTGGNNHAINHFKETNHPIVVKTGTITPSGEACKYY